MFIEPWTPEEVEFTSIEFFKASFLDLLSRLIRRRSLLKRIWGHSFLIESKGSWSNHNHILWTLLYHSWSWLRRRRCHFDSVFSLQISQCGGWLVAKDVNANAICATSLHGSAWKYFDQGVLKEDDTFQILERCTFQGDFFPVPPTVMEFKLYKTLIFYEPKCLTYFQEPPVTTLLAPSKPLGYPQYHYPPLTKPTVAPTPASSSVKHEHYHYHYENWDGGNGVTGKSPPQSTSAYVYSRPLEVVNSNPSLSYKNQYRGDPYRKRSDDDRPYFPIDDKKSIVDNVTFNEDKNSRKIQ